MPQLLIVSGALAGQEFSFTDAVVIGRGSLCDVRIDDGTVSRRHAQLTVDAAGAWTLTDLGSANGSRIDGVPVNPSQYVPDTAELCLGEVRALFRRQTPAVDATAAIPLGGATAQLLVRLRLMLTLARLPASRGESAQLPAQALAAVRDAFSGCSHVALYRGGNGTALRLEQLSGETPAPSYLALLAEEAQRHVGGLAGRIDPARLDGHVPPASVLIAPLVHAGETLGALVACAPQTEAWVASDAVVATAIASEIGGLIAAARGDDPDRRIAERDLALARRVQQHFLPPSAPAWPGYTTAEAYVPARAVGGDHYDFFRYADGRAGALIADVSGKAVSAALVAARFGMALRLLAPTQTGPAALLSALNATLAAELEPGMFVTALALALEPASGVVELASAGHPAPLLRAPDGQVGELVIDNGSALGVSTSAVYPAKTCTLARGAALLLHSDGLGEAENADGIAFGTERSIAAFSGRIDARTALDRLTQTLAGFVGTAPPFDDLTLVVIARG